MAKKKNKEKVSINGSPLQAITIGEIKVHKYGWIGTIILFSLFIGIVFYLPDLFEMYQQYVQNNTPSVPEYIDNTATNNTVTPGGRDDDDDDEVVTYTFLEKSGFKFDTIQVKDITYVDGALTYKITNLTDDSISLDSLDLFFGLYDRSNNLLVTHFVSGNLSAGETEDFTHLISDEIKDQIIAYNMIEQGKN